MLSSSTETAAITASKPGSAGGNGGNGAGGGGGGGGCFLITTLFLGAYLIPIPPAN